MILTHIQLFSSLFLRNGFSTRYLVSMNDLHQEEISVLAHPEHTFVQWKMIYIIMNTRFVPWVSMSFLNQRKRTGERVIWIDVVRTRCESLSTSRILKYNRCYAILQNETALRIEKKVSSSSSMTSTWRLRPDIREAIALQSSSALGKDNRNRLKIPLMKDVIHNWLSKGMHTSERWCPKNSRDF